MMGAAGLDGWLDEHTGWRRAVSRVLQGRVERRGAWLRTTGFTCLALIVVQAVTGAVLGLYYAPAPTEAFRDVAAIDADKMGRFLRGLHHWAAAALLIAAALAVARMYFGAEYKRRPVAWIASLFFLVLVLLLQLTGHILPWDTNSAATADVEAAIAGNVWAIGPFLQSFLLGGSATGGETLNRWYGFHTLLFPMGVVAVVGLPLLLNRMGPGRAEAATGRDGQSEPYYPNHMAREMVVALAVFLAVAAIAWAKRTPLEAEATAANLAGYRVAPAWYVLPLHAAITMPPFDRAAFEPIATVILPGLMFTGLLALPFLDRNPAGRLAKRPAALAAGILVLLGTAGLTTASMVQEHEAREREVGKMAVGIDGRRITIDTRLAAMGRSAFAQQGCTGCHSVNGKGGSMGPDLTHAGLRHPDRDWQIQHLISPRSKVPGSQMPSFAGLKQSDLRALAEYILSRR